MSEGRPELGDLYDEGWLERERLIGRFEEDWRAGLRPSIDGYLEDWDAERDDLLIELVHVEIELRLESGESVRVADYLSGHPELVADDATIRRLFEAVDGHLREFNADLEPSAGFERSSSSIGRTRPPQRLGKYELFEPVGRGSFGVVYRASDTQLGRKVAVKLSHRGLIDDPGDEERFLREARNAASIRHPGIVTVFDAGRIDGTFALVSDFIVGRSLAEEMKLSLPSPRRSAEWIEQVAEAIGAAHREGIIHRDLKPANILINERGQPLVTDFGLARSNADTTLTANGQVLGTPAYMPPEQVRGESRGVDFRGDVYSLGVILYELLTGELPFRGQGNRLNEQILAEAPRPPRRLDDQIPRDLETICLKCLEKEPGHRYPTAIALAEDLRRFQAGEAIDARPTPAWRLFALKIRRKPRIATLIAVSVVSILALLGLWVHYSERERRHAVEVTASDRLHAEMLRDESRKTRLSLYDVELRLAYDAYEKSRVEQARQILVEQVPREGEEDLRAFEWHHLWRRCNRDLVLRGHEGSIRDLAFSRDGRTMATAGADRSIRIWDTASWKERRKLVGHEKLVSALVFSPDGDTLYSGSYDGTVRRWSAVNDEKPSILVSGQGAILSVHLGPDGRMLAFSHSYDTAIILVDTVKRGEMGRLDGLTKVAWSLEFSSDGRSVAALSAQGEVATWDLSSRSLNWMKTGHDGSGNSLVFNPTGQTIVTSAMDGEVIIWDAATGAERKRIRAAISKPVSELAISQDERYVAISHREGVLLWDQVTDRAVATLKGHIGTVRAIAFDPAGDTLATGGDDGIVRLWNTATASPCPSPLVALDNQEPATSSPRARVPCSLNFSHDGRSFVIGEEGGGVEVWDRVRGSKLLRFDSGSGTARSLAFAPDDKSLAVAGDSTPVRFWDLATGSVVKTMDHLEQEPATPWWSLAVSPDGQTVVAGNGGQGRPGTIEAWNTANGRRLASLRGHQDYVRAVAFSPDGQVVASGSGDETVKLWDWAATRELATLTGHRGQIFCIAFRPDGNLLASGSEDHSIRFWDVEKRCELATLRGHVAPVHSLAFTPDGRRLASAGRDGSILIWDTETFRVIAAPGAHALRVNQVEFSPDGDVLGSVSFDCTLRFLVGRPTD